MFTRPLWAEISRHRLLANYEKLRHAAGSQADVMAVVKANAYGHDVLACAPLLAGAGAQWLGVTGAEEGAAVRAVCPQPRILLMSGIFPGEAETVIDQGLTPVVWEPWQLDLLEAAAAARRLPAASLAVHLEIDTGMSRQGVRVVGTDVSPEAASLLLRFHAGSCLRLEGVMTHFCAPETMSSHRPNPQLASLGAALEFIACARPSPAVAACGQLVEHRRGTRPAGPDRDGVAGGSAADVARRPCALWLPRPSHPGRVFLGWGRPGLCAGAHLEDPGDLVAHPACRRDGWVWQHFHR